MVFTDMNAAPADFAFDTDPKWSEYRRNVDWWVTARKMLYAVQVELTLVAVVVAGYFWIWPRTAADVNVVTRFLADSIHYVTPKMFEGLIDVIVAQEPMIGGGVAAFLYAYWRIRSNFAKKTKRAAEDLRKLVRRDYDPKSHAPAA